MAHTVSLSSRQEETNDSVTRASRISLPLFSGTKQQDLNTLWGDGVHLHDPTAPLLLTHPILTILALVLLKPSRHFLTLFMRLLDTSYNHAWVYAVSFDQYATAEVIWLLTTGTSKQCGFLFSTPVIWYSDWLISFLWELFHDNHSMTTAWPQHTRVNILLSNSPCPVPVSHCLMGLSVVVVAIVWEDGAWCRCLMADEWCGISYMVEQGCIVFEWEHCQSYWMSYLGFCIRNVTAY